MNISNDTDIHTLTSPKIQLTDIRCILLPTSRFFLLRSQYFSDFLARLSYISTVLFIFEGWTRWPTVVPSNPYYSM